MPFRAFGVLTLLAMLSGMTRADQLKPEYQKWLNEDVRWIMTSQERAQFTQLPTDQARDRFVVKFWEHRNPAPGSRVNAFKTEHYRRLAFANQHFAARLPGWETDRGRIYILYGPPDAIARHPGAIPDEVWSYRRLNGNENVTFRFVDRCLCGDYSLID
jgi:GWxTD domain-containing protein